MGGRYGTGNGLGLNPWKSKLCMRLSWKIATWGKWLHDEWSESSRTDGMVCDTTTGKALDPAKVKEGRKEELGYMRKMHVWDRAPRSEAA